MERIISTCKNEKIGGRRALFGGRHFLPTFCCCWQKVGRIEGILCEKRHADAARDDASEANALTCKIKITASSTPAPLARRLIKGKHSKTTNLSRTGGPTETGSIKDE